MGFVDIYVGDKKVAEKVKNCSRFYQKVLGLMFVSSPKGGAFLPGVKDIHMNFVRFPLKIIWLDKDMIVLRVVRAKPWGLYNGPEGARNVLELPVDNQFNFQEGMQISIKKYERI